MYFTSLFSMILWPTCSTQFVAAAIAVLAAILGRHAVGGLQSEIFFLLRGHAADVLILMGDVVVVAMAEIGDQRDDHDHRGHQQTPHDGGAATLFFFVHLSHLPRIALPDRKGPGRESRSAGR